MADDVLTIAAAAALLGVTAKTLRRWDATGVLRAVRDPMSGYRIYRKSDLERFRDQGPARATLIGREELLEELRAARDPILTLVGLPGVGRTAVARALVRDLGGTYVDAAEEALPELQEGLFVLDHVGAVSSRGARLVVVANAPLELPGERVVIIPPLSLTASRELFLRHAPQASGIDDLLRYLSGLPLAIELAAQRAALLPGSVPRLQDPSLLRRTGGLPRHRTWQSAFAHGWQLLPDSDRRALLDASAFAHPLVPAHARVSLRRSGWIDTSSRLPPLIADTLRRMPSFGAAALRHARTVRHAPMEAHPDDVLLAIERDPECASSLADVPFRIFEADHSRLRPALETALAQTPNDALLLAMRGRLDASLGRIADARTSLDAAERGRGAHVPRAALDLALDLAEIALPPAKSIARLARIRADVPSLSHHAALRLGVHRERSGDLRAAATLYREASAAHDSAIRARALARGALVAWRQGEDVALADALDDALKVATACPRTAAQLRNWKAYAAIEAGELADTPAHEDPELRAECMRSRAWALFDGGDCEAAWRAMEGARRLAAERFPALEAVATLDLALFALVLGEASAREQLEAVRPALDVHDRVLAILATAYLESANLSEIEATLVARGASRAAEAAAALRGVVPRVSSTRARLALQWSAARSGASLVVSDDGFQYGGQPVSLAERPVLRDVLHALADAPAGLRIEELLILGWPDETLRPERARHRVHRAIGALRRLGLTCIATEGGAYRLTVPVRRKDGVHSRPT
ncbi:MAG: MerR family DNA-binding transcriptional regulator [Myxococcota bacterium]